MSPSPKVGVSKLRVLFKCAFMSSFILSSADCTGSSLGFVTTVKRLLPSEPTLFELRLIDWALSGLRLFLNEAACDGVVFFNEVRFDCGAWTLLSKVFAVEIFRFASRVALSSGLS